MARVGKQMLNMGSELRLVDGYESESEHEAKQELKEILNEAEIRAHRLIMDYAKRKIASFPQRTYGVSVTPRKSKKFNFPRGIQGPAMPLEMRVGEIKCKVSSDQAIFPHIFQQEIYLQLSGPGLIVREEDRICGNNKRFNVPEYETVYIILTPKGLRSFKGVRARRLEDKMTELQQDDICPLYDPHGAKDDFGKLEDKIHQRYARRAINAIDYHCRKTETSEQ